MARPKRHAEQGDCENADQRTSDYAAAVERRNQHEAAKREDRRPHLGQVAERDQRRRVSDHDLGLLEAMMQKEQADAGGNRELEAARN